MGSIPFDRRRQAMLARQLGKNLPVVVFSWGPVPLTRSFSPVEAPWHEIDSQPELMCALPRSRFRGAFGEQVRLPSSTAETLEGFEQELRKVGLIRKDEVLRQSAKLPAHFRVQVRNKKLLATDLHLSSSIVSKDAGAISRGERAPPLRCSERREISKLVSSLESEEQRPYVHDKTPAGRAQRANLNNMHK